MNGLDNIIAKINADCQAECDAILAKADAEADEILKKAKSESALLRQGIIENALRENEKEIQLLKSRAQLESKKNLLALKIELVNGIIETALERLRNLPDADYFSVIKSLVLKHAQKGTATLRLSKNELARLPIGFEGELNKALGDGFSVKIGPEPVRIDGGFILVYDDIDQNCSFEALLASSIDDIKDLLYETLFKRTDI